ncbi:hypothetical protein [Shimia haliotis]|uniref:Porin n=1 Tax=Shimia haliotis TaxID=1280847 RepID=A0A1I4EAP0_9RHOB|nr:hypothetical protein [Shimia haliotis]SFL02815.1 hypothetical protein SAMN04488036_104154 [Shimia haliotis]
MKNSILFGSLVLAISASVAQAAELTSVEARIAYERSEAVGLDFNSWNIAGDATVSLSESFDLNFGIARANPSNTIGGVNNLTRLSFGGQLDVSETTFVGAFVDSTYVSGGGSDWAFVYGLEGGVEVDKIAASAFIGQGDYDALGAPAKSLVYGVDVGYSVSDTLDFGAFYLREDMDTSFDMAQYGLSVGNQFSMGGNTPVYLSAHLSRIDGSGANATQFGLSLSFALQGDASLGRKTFSRTSVFHNTWSSIGGLF